MQTYHISESRFGYTYRAEGYSAAIAKWVEATFCEGCIPNEPDNFGNFQVFCQAGKTAPALTIRAKISRVDSTQKAAKEAQA